MSRIKTIVLWIIALTITADIALYQLLTGPTHPINGKKQVGNDIIQYTFLRSFKENQPLLVSIKGASETTGVYLIYKRFKAKEDWSQVEMKREGDEFKAYIPGLPAAAKTEYFVKLLYNGKEYYLNNGKAAVVRFRGDVPATFIILHVIFMLLGILFSLRTGMEATERINKHLWIIFCLPALTLIKLDVSILLIILNVVFIIFGILVSILNSEKTPDKKGSYLWMIYCTVAITAIGGLILGPIVQKYAFGDLWTGFPIGYDLTDNKTITAIIFWIIALIMAKLKKSHWWIVAAAVIMLIVYLIPHSVLGSELDPATGKMKNVFYMKINSIIHFK